MARSSAILTTFQLVQQLDPDFFDWTDEEKKAIEDEDKVQIANIICQKLLDKDMIPAEIHIIIHDKDMRTVWDDTVSNYVVEQKPKHFHCVVKFWKDDEDKIRGNSTLVNIAAALGVEPQYIEKPQKGRFAYDNMLAYLIHIKYADKAQYDPSEVYTTGTMNTETQKAYFKQYQEYYNEKREEWLKGRAKVKNEKAKLDIDDLEEKILLGEVVRDQILLTDELYDIYARHKRRVDDALDSYAQRKIAKAIQAMENGEFKVSVFFITGKSHSGKSRFTDYLVKKLRIDAKEQFDEDWRVCAVAATNPFDEYMGEEILVMDDLRGLALTASDWLKLLDPERINIGSARYHNKRMACRAIIINSEKDVLQFFYYMKGGGSAGGGEALDQFFRRILARVVVYRVPDDEDTRRLQIGSMQETNKYLAAIPGTEDYHGDPQQVALHHDFKKDVQDMEYDEALDYLSAMVMDRNGLKKEE